MNLTDLNLNLGLNFLFEIIINKFNYFSKFNSDNKIGYLGAMKLIECVSKLKNLTDLDINFKYKCSD